MKRTLFAIPMSIILVLFLYACSATKNAPQTVNQPQPEPEKTSETASDPVLPVDSKITIGKLNNGLTYYIRENKRPENRAELRLALNAGSILEDDDQQGLAHFVEHMAFNGTENFEKQEIVNYLESIGMRFGPDINAYTSFDETVYMLEIPTDSAEIVKTAFQILEEWAHRVSFEDEEIDKERGVVIEEWRSGRGAQMRMLDKQLPVLFKDSQYANRLPIGKKEILEGFDYDAARRFYRDWYRPDLMAVVAVGDFDKNEIENLIKKHFAGISPVENPRERTVYPVPDNAEPLFAIATDPEATRTIIGVYYKKDVPEEGTESAYRQSIVEQLYNGVLNNRLDELRQQPEPPFLFGFSSQGSFIRTKHYYSLGAAVKEDQIESGLEALLIEAERIKKFGITQTELERQKTDMLRGMERAFNERDKTESGRYAAEYIRNFLTDEPIPGIEHEFQLYQKYIPTVTLEEVNRLAEELITDHNRVVLLSTPEKDDANIPSEASLLAVFENVTQKEITAYVDEVSDEPLIATPPTPGEIVGEETIAEIDVTLWKLSNGARVILKSTDFKNDQVLFSAYSPGGNSLVTDENYVSAITATAIVAQGGVGNFNQIELDKKLAGKVVRVSPGISSLQEGFSGSASPQDIETLFQLTHLYFTSPRKDNNAFLSYQTRLKGFLANRGASPEAAFSDTLSVTLSQYHFRSRPWNEDMLDEMNLERSFEIYKDRFADAGDFTFLFVGNIDIEGMKPLVKTYLASLPSQERKETWKDVGVNPPNGIIEKEVRKGLEPKSQVRVVFSGPFEWNRQNRHEINSMTAVLRIKLREVLREDQGGTYGVRVSASPSHYPQADYQITIGFGCAPDRVEELTQLAFQQIDSLKNFGTTDEYLQKVKESQRRQHEKNLKENRYWINTLEFYDYHKEPLLSILETNDFVEKLNLEAIRKAAQKYLNEENYVKVVLYPEGT